MKNATLLQTVRRRLLPVLLCLCMAAGLFVCPVSAQAKTSDTGLYYDELDTGGKKIYNILKKNVTRTHPYATFSSDINSKWDYPDIVTAFMKDHPELVAWNYYNGYSYGWGGDTVRISLNVISGCTAAKEKKMKAQVNSILKNMSATTTYGRVKYFHDWLIKHCEYITQDNGTYAHTAMGCLVYKTGVCESYAKTFKILCDRVKIPCILVEGDNHEWNYVKMSDGKWYMVDCTFDDPIGNGSRCNYTYFLVSNNPYTNRHHFYSTDNLKVMKTSTTNYKGSKACLTKTAPTLKRTSTGVSISWNGIRAVNGYQILRKAANESKYSWLKTTTKTSFKDTTAKKGVKYSYKVRGFMNIGSTRHYFACTNAATA